MKRFANIKGLLIGIAALGLSFALLGPMGGRGGYSGGGSNATSNATGGFSRGAMGGGGLPLLEIGIGLAILAVLIWWFDLRKQGKKQ